MTSLVTHTHKKRNHFTFNQRDNVCLFVLFTKEVWNDILLAWFLSNNFIIMFWIQCLCVCLCSAMQKKTTRIKGCANQPLNCWKNYFFASHFFTHCHRLCLSLSLCHNLFWFSFLLCSLFVWLFDFYIFQFGRLLLCGVW